MLILKSILKLNHIQARKFCFNVDVFPALTDNYMYLLTHNETKCCAAVDPVEPEKISSHILKNNLNLTHILITHHHWDHSSGTNKLLSYFPGKEINVVGHDDRIEALNYKVQHRQLLQIGDTVVRCLLTPCHTIGHIMYFIESKTNNFALFSGDTFFVAGCGRFFEGNAADMYECIKTLTSLPLSTKIYCGHEYSIKNLEFSLSIDPLNEDVQKKLIWAKKQASQDLVTVPTTLIEEMNTNPFLRSDKDHFKKITGENDPILIIQILRNMKDCF